MNAPPSPGVGGCSCVPCPHTVLHAGMEIRDATPEDAEEACLVLRRSITELCEADHHGDPALLAAWLSNKRPEIVAAWMRRTDASYLVAIEQSAIAAVGGVTDGGEILLNYVSPDARFRGVSRALLAAMEARAWDRGATMCNLIAPRRRAASISLADMRKLARRSENSGWIPAIQCPRS